MRALSMRPHATADDLADDVRAVIGTISRQAVYDTLGVLVDKNLIRRIQPPSFGLPQLWQHVRHRLRSRVSAMPDRRRRSRLRDRRSRSRLLGPLPHVPHRLTPQRHRTIRIRVNHHIFNKEQQ